MLYDRQEKKYFTPIAIEGPTNIFNYSITLSLRTVNHLQFFVFTQQEERKCYVKNGLQIQINYARIETI